jgi:hypothetical protein
MSDSGARGDTVSAQISGDVSGQVAVGKQVEQHQTLGDSAVAALSDAELTELRRAFAELKAQVAAAAPPDAARSATERVDELEQAVFADRPDLTTIQYVTRWFRTQLPSVAGAVTGLVVHPLVGRLVESTGTLLARELAELVGAE